jgi:hypothetical protein
MPVVKSREYKDINRLEKKVLYTFTQKFKGDQQAIEEARHRIEPFLFTLHNGGVGVPSNDLDAIANDMREQVDLISKRKDGTYYGENFLNFSGKDFDLNNHDEDYIRQVKFTMADITRKWVELRGLGNTTWVARPHFDTDNAHIHLLFTKNERDEKKRVHLTKAEFLKAQNDLNDYQRNHHPLLKSTFEKKIEPRNRQRSRQEDMRVLMKKTGRPQTVKQKLVSSLSEIIPFSKNLKSLSSSMKKNGFEVYERGGTPYGIVKDNKRYRFATLLKGTEHETRINTYVAEAKQLAKARKRLGKSMQKSKDRDRGLDRNLERDL